MYLCWVESSSIFFIHRDPRLDSTTSEKRSWLHHLPVKSATLRQSVVEISLGSEVVNKGKSPTCSPIAGRSFLSWGPSLLQEAVERPSIRVVASCWSGRRIWLRPYLDTSGACDRVCVVLRPVPYTCTSSTSLIFISVIKIVNCCRCQAIVCSSPREPVCVRRSIVVEEQVPELRNWPVLAC